MPPGFVRMRKSERTSREMPRSNTYMPPVLVGGDILSLVTAGMYNNPLAIYREYIQNAADAVGGNRSQGGLESPGGH